MYELQILTQTRLPPIEAWQFWDILGCPVSGEEISWPWSFSTKPLQFVSLLTAKPSRKSCTCCSFIEESSFSPMFLLVLNAIQSKVKFHVLVAPRSLVKLIQEVPVCSKRTMYNFNLSRLIWNLWKYIILFWLDCKSIAFVHTIFTLTLSWFENGKCSSHINNSSACTLSDDTISSYCNS